MSRGVVARAWFDSTSGLFGQVMYGHVTFGDVRLGKEVREWSPRCGSIPRPDASVRSGGTWHGDARSGLGV